jgi:hypothetical protein
LTHVQSPASRLHQMHATWVVTRYKKNVSENVPGLTFIEKLRPPPASVASIRNLHGEVRAGGFASILLPAGELKAREETIEKRKAREDKARIVYDARNAQRPSQAERAITMPCAVDKR